MNPDETQERPTNLVDLMAELVPPPEPEPISLVPQTFGWPLLALLLVAFATYATVRFVQKRREEAYRDAALASLDAAGKDPATVAQLLRQTALTAFPRRDVAGLYGHDWLAFLDATCDGVQFQSDVGKALVTAPYQGRASMPDETLALVRRWISHHRRPGAS